MKLKFIEEKAMKVVMLVTTLLVFLFVGSILYTIVKNGWGAMNWEMIAGRRVLHRQRRRVAECYRRFVVYCGSFYGIGAGGEYSCRVLSECISEKKFETGFVRPTGV